MNDKNNSQDDSELEPKAKRSRKEIEAVAENEARGRSDEEKGLASEVADRWDYNQNLPLDSIGTRAESLRGSPMMHTLLNHAPVHYRGMLAEAMNNAQIITGTLAHELTEAHHAQALTIGSNIFVGKSVGTLDHTNAAHMGLLGHEATHLGQDQNAFKKESGTGPQTQDYEVEADKVGEAIKESIAKVKSDTEASKRKKIRMEALLGATLRMFKLESSRRPGKYQNLVSQNGRSGFVTTTRKRRSQ